MKQWMVVERDTRASNGLLVPEGSVLKDIKENKNTYRGLWNSGFGSFKVSVKKKHCKPYLS